MLLSKNKTSGGSREMRMMEDGERASETEQTAPLDNRSILQLQRNVMQGTIHRLELFTNTILSSFLYKRQNSPEICVKCADQDEELEELSRVVTSTKHIGLAVGEELDLHARLLDGLEDDVDNTSSRLRRAQKIAKMVYEKSSNCKLMMCGTLLIVVLVLFIALILKHS